jgi:hypothetical protein
LSARKARPRDAACPLNVSPNPGELAPLSPRHRHASLDRRLAEKDPRRRWVRYMREHANTLVLVGVLVMIALPPTVVIPSSSAELIVTGTVTIAAVVLAILIHHEIRRR